MKIDADLATTLAAVVDEGTLDAAARRLHVTPSAVSQRVKLLEDQLGQRLLVRSKPARATTAGDVVVRFARHVALMEHDARVALGIEDDEGRSRLVVAVNSDSLATWLLEPLTTFAEERLVELDLRREDQARTVRLLEEGVAVAAITSQPEPVPGCRVVPLGSLTFEATASPAWMERWAPDGVTPDVLERAPRIDFDRSDSLQLEWLAQHGVDGRRSPRHLVPSTHDITRAVELGLGWGVVPSAQAEELVAAGRLVSLGDPTVSTHLYWQVWKDSSALLVDLTSAIEHAARRVLVPAP